MGRGANRVVSRQASPERVLETIAQLVGVAHRVAVRTVSRVQVAVGRGTGQVLCQTENISTSGMLLRTDRSFPVGSTFSFELALPGEDKPIRGLAQVVRVTAAREHLSRWQPGWGIMSGSGRAWRGRRLCLVDTLEWDSPRGRLSDARPLVRAAR